MLAMKPIDIKHNLKSILGRIEKAKERFRSPSEEVFLLAISKGQPIELIKDLANLNQLSFGESYVQEALPKISALKNKNLDWHYIGVIQSNKTADIAKNFSWVHTVSRFLEAEKLSQYRDAPTPLNICLQVKLDNSSTKSGALPIDVLTLAKKVNELPHLRLRGLMAIAPLIDDFSEQRRFFSRLRELFAQLRDSGLPLDTLSMGMTNDFEAAIAEGSTLVRIGTGLFGPRG